MMENNTIPSPSESLAFLGQDHQACVRLLMHYESTIIDITKFTFGQLIAAPTAAWAIYIFANGNDTPIDLEQIWPLIATAVLSLSFFLSLIAIRALARQRLYVATIARYLNELRRRHFQNPALGFSNISGMFTDPLHPKPYDGHSSTVLSIILITIMADFWGGGALYCLFTYVFKLPFNRNLPIFFTVVLALIFLSLWAGIYYLVRKQDTSGDDIISPPVRGKWIIFQVGKAKKAEIFEKAKRYQFKTISSFIMSLVNHADELLGNQEEDNNSM